MANISQATVDTMSGMRNAFSVSGKKTETGAVSNLSNETSASKKRTTGGATINNAFYTTITEGQEQPLKRGDGLANIFAKIYNLLKAQQEENKKQYELEQDFAREKEDEVKRKGMFRFGGETKTVQTAVKEEDEEEHKSFFKKIFGALLGGITGVFGTLLSGITSIFSGIFSVITSSIGFIAKFLWGTANIALSVLEQIPKIFGTISLLYKAIKKSIGFIINETTLLIEKYIGRGLLGGALGSDSGTGGKKSSKIFRMVKGVAKGALEYELFEAFSKNDDEKIKRILGTGALTALLVTVAAITDGLGVPPLMLLIEAFGAGTMAAGITEAFKDVRSAEQKFSETFFYGEKYSKIHDEYLDFFNEWRKSNGERLQILNDKINLGKQYGLDTKKDEDEKNKLLDEFKKKSQDYVSRMKAAKSEYEPELEKFLKEKGYSIKIDKTDGKSVMSVVDSSGKEIDLIELTKMKIQKEGLDKAEDILKTSVGEEKYNDLISLIENGQEYGQKFYEETKKNIQNIPQHYKEFMKIMGGVSEEVSKDFNNFMKIMRETGRVFELPTITQSETIPLPSKKQQIVKDFSIRMRTDDPTLKSVLKQNLRPV
jgi:hypothetical protein